MRTLAAIDNFFVICKNAVYGFPSCICSLDKFLHLVVPFLVFSLCGIFFLTGSLLGSLIVFWSSYSLHGTYVSSLFFAVNLQYTFQSYTTFFRVLYRFYLRNCFSSLQINCVFFLFCYSSFGLFFGILMCAFASFLFFFLLFLTLIPDCHVLVF